VARSRRGVAGADADNLVGVNAPVDPPPVSIPPPGPVRLAAWLALGQAALVVVVAVVVIGATSVRSGLRPVTT